MWLLPRFQLSTLTNFSFYDKMIEVTYSVSYECCSTKCISTNNFFIPSRLIRSPFQGVHNILCYTITMDLGWREPYFSIVWPVCFKTPLLMLPLGLAGLEEAPSVLWKCPAKVNLIKLSSIENIIGWDILVFCKVVVLPLSHTKKLDLICHSLLHSAQVQKIW